MAPDIMAAPPPARLFELTRVMRLATGLPSGVDRVCLAYLRALLAAPEPLFGLYRSSFGYLLLDQDGIQALLERLEGRTPWGAPDLLTRIVHKRGRHQFVVEPECRRQCVARCRPRFLTRMLGKHLPDGTVYVNVDQSNLPTRLLRALKSIPGGRIAAFLHDTIPLDFPELQTPPSRLKFEKLLHRIQDYADVILTNSQVSADDIARHMAPRGPVPEIVVSHLGIEPFFFQSGDNPILPPVPKPYFLVLGTIEPRKKHALLLDIWEVLAKDLPPEYMPHLVICGRRGWLNEDVFKRLDSSPMRGTYLHEFNDMNDAQIQGLIHHATACLFPSVVEGFGLPPVEAAAAGVPVICNDLPVFREILGDIPIYASVTDSYAWKQAIIELARQALNKGKKNQTARAHYVPPSWEDHFNTVLKVV